MSDYIERSAAKEAAWENIINNVVEEQGMYGYLVNLVDKVFDAIPAADVQPKWISVEERLPEEPGEYIVFIRDPFYGKDEPQDDFNVDASYVTSCFYDKDGGLWREWDNSYYCANLQCVNTNKMYYITHWMPLPEKPEEEQK